MLGSLGIKGVKILVDDVLTEANIKIESGKIKQIGKPSQVKLDNNILNGKKLIALPGLIDAHVHMRDLELSYKEDYFTGTCAAAAGGFTTVIDMPNTRPPTDSSENLKTKIHNAKEKIITNIAFHCLPPKDLTQIEELVSLGVKSFKLYLGDSHFIDQTFMTDKLPTILNRCRALNIPLTIHPEDIDLIENEKKKLSQKEKWNLKDFLNIHSPNAEIEAVKTIQKINGKNRIHLCHLSIYSSISLIKKAKLANISTEVTPHHLFLNIQKLLKMGGVALTNPPLRSETERKKLWRELKTGAFNIIASDHAPHLLEEKSNKNIREVPPGIPGLETTLPLLLTQVNQDNISLNDVIKLLSENPAELFSLQNKGELKKGFDADITLIDLKTSHYIDPSTFFSKSKYTPFNHFKCSGKAKVTICQGEIIYNDGEIVAKKGSGKVLGGN